MIGITTAASFSKPNDTFFSSGTARVVLVTLIACILLRILAKYQVGALLLPLVALAILFASRRMPNVVGSLWIFGWIYVPLMGTLGGLTFPSTSLLAVWTIACLSYWRLRGLIGGARINVANALLVSCFVLVLVIGVVGFLASGHFGNPLARASAWQKLIVAIFFLSAGYLSCVNIQQLKQAIAILPVLFLMYVIYIPPESYIYLLSLSSGASIWKAGLEFDVLNTNTLAQGAVLALVICVAAVSLRGPTKYRGLYLAILCIAVGVIVASAARQAWIAALVAGSLLLIRRNRVIGYAISALVVLAFAVVVQMASEMSDRPAFMGRLAEIGTPVNEWQTGSFSYRAEEALDGLNYWWSENVLFGFGFGGWRLREFPAIDLNPIDFTADETLNDMSLLAGEHNFPVALLVQTGAVGFVLFFTFVVGTYARFFRMTKKPLEGIRQNEMSFIRDALIGIGAAIFILQNISGGFAPGAGSLGTLFFLLGAMLSVMSHTKLRKVKITNVSRQP